MKVETNVQTINEWIREKQALEVSLAFDMLDIFNAPGSGLIAWLRNLVSQSVIDMDIRRGASPVEFNRKWDGSWSHYDCCQAHGIRAWDTEAIRRAMLRFKAEQCADWIRIYGEVIEDVSHGTEDATRKGYQQGDPDHWTKLKVDPVTKKIVDYNDPHRLRRREAPAHGATPPTIVHEMFRFPDSSSGLAKWDVLPGDTCGKMDKVFGLCPGATISGTTTDNIYYFEKFGRSRLDPLIYLLPVAAIVSGGHHTLLEVALPLSLNHIVDYRVGLYTTLFPLAHRDRTSELATAAHEIMLTLSAAEDNPANRLMLLYYDQPNVVEPAGCLLFEGADRAQWEQFAVAGEQLMEYFRTLPPAPGRGHVDALRGKVFSHV